jgi:hypothetical protein
VRRGRWLRRSRDVEGVALGGGLMIILRIELFKGELLAWGIISYKDMAGNT